MTVVQPRSTSEMPVVAQRSAKRAEALVEYSADLIFVLDDEGRVVSINPATERLLGSRLGEKVDDLMVGMIHPDDVDIVRSTLAAVYSHPGPHTPLTFRIMTRDGGWRHLASVASNKLGDPAANGVIFNARDVTNEVLAVEQVLAGQRALTDALIRATESRDPYTAGHQRQVATLSRRLAVQMGLPAAQVDTIELGASLHDIGKIAVPSEILAWPGRLSAHQLGLMKDHPQVGADILGTTGLPADVRDVILHHHERLDGSGYPDGLASGKLSTAVRIVAVADVLDAMTSHRPYRPAVGLDAARGELERGSGTLYDPDVVAAALAVTGSSAAIPALPGPRPELA